MKTNAILIDFRNKEQVKWWNNIASKMVRASKVGTLDETATGKTIGVLLTITGPLAKVVMKWNKRFLDSPVTTVIDVEE